MTHRIFNGDAVDIMSSFTPGSVDLIVTDVPYGINYKSNKQNCDTRGDITIHKDRAEYFSSIANDNEIPTSWLKEAYRVLKDGSAIYVFCHWSTWHLLYPGVENAGFKIKNMLVMNKSNHGMGDLKGQYAPKHELLLFAVKGRHLLKFPEKRLNDVWDVPVKYSGAIRLHPNEKPLSWLTPCIENSSQPGGTILDPFCGSGSTGVAAKKLGRSSILIDIDEQFIEIASNRMSGDV